jgi:hypothetical protein
MTESGTKPRRNAPIWLKALLAFHVIAITSWSLPRAKPEELKVGIDTRNPRAAFTSFGRSIGDGVLLANERYIRVSPVQTYVLTTGFWQYWDMFAPNPASVDYYGTAEVTYKDGSKLTYEYPRVYTLPIPAKYPNERYRKFYERASSESFQYLWPHFAQRVALVSFKDKQNPPVKVKLFRHSLVIARPRKPQETQYTKKEYFSYDVVLPDLERLSERG